MPSTTLSVTRWLPGFARVPYYAPSPCHKHPGHNCHHIKSCHPPDKQSTGFIIYTCSLFFICNNKVSKARAALWDDLWIYCILASALLRIPPLKFPSMAPSIAPPPFLGLNPSSAHFLPPAVHASSRPFLARSLHQPFLHQPSLPQLTLSACLASSLPTSLPVLSPSLPCSLPPPPSLCSLPPSVFDE